MTRSSRSNLDKSYYHTHADLLAAVSGDSRLSRAALKRGVIREKYVVMLGTAFETMGGVSAVVNVYREHGLFDRWPVLYLPTHCDGGPLKKFGLAFKSLVRYIGLLFSGQVRMVHVHSSSYASFWRKSFFMALAFLADKPVIFHLHGAEFDMFLSQKCGTLARRFVICTLEKASCITVLSSQWQSWMSGIVRNPNIVRIFNPIIRTNKVLSASHNSSKVLFLGRLGQRKGIFDLLEAVARLGPDFPELELLCGGDGDADAVSRRTEALGIQDRVRLLGWVRGPEKEALLASAGIFVLPSYHEGLPMSILEAMAAGLPVVSTRVGGIPDAITSGKEGFLIEAGDVDALEAALRRLLANPDLAQAMGAEGLGKVAAEFDADKVIPQIEALYRKLGVQPLLADA